MTTYKLKKGHDIKIAGKPAKTISKIERPISILIHPNDINGVKPKLIVKEGSSVKIGTPLFLDKNNTDGIFTSPVSGTLSKITFGERRAIISLEIEVSDDNHVKFESFEENNPLDSDYAKKLLLESGMWTYIRQRPFSKIANPSDTPKSIFISAMSKVPFALDQSIALENRLEDLQKGVNVLKTLTNGVVNFVCNPSDFTILEDVSKSNFSGPHPAGNVGIHIHHIDPIKDKNDVVWYVSPQDVADIGYLFSTGKLNNSRIISVGGTGVKNPQYFEVIKGTPLANILDNNLNKNVRIISGDILSGSITNATTSIGYYDEIISVLPDEDERYFLGWLSPGFCKYSITNTFLSKIFRKKEYNLNTLKNGGERAIIPFGNIENMVPMEIMPTFLMKAILARDIEEMENLGIYECDSEDFALCSFADTSKMEVSEIIREGLEFIEVEG